MLNVVLIEYIYIRFIGYNFIKKKFIEVYKFFKICIIYVNICICRGNRVNDEEGGFRYGDSFNKTVRF